jgi:hypothetical protein
MILIKGHPDKIARCTVGDEYNLSILGVTHAKAVIGEPLNPEALGGGQRELIDNFFQKKLLLTSIKLTEHMQYFTSSKQRGI